MKTTFFKGISLMLLMLSLLFVSCEKIIPLEELEPGDFYSDGTVSGFVVASFLISDLDVSAPNTLHIISEFDVGPCYGTDVYQYEKDGWRIPIKGELLTMSQTPELWDTNHNFNLQDAYWCTDDGNLKFFIRDPDLRDGRHMFTLDEGNQHRLRLYQIIQF